MKTAADEAIHRLQNMAPFTLFTILDDGSITEWWTPSPSELAELVVLREDRLHQDIVQIGVHIMEWSRIAAQAQRVWEIQTRVLRTWKAQQMVEGKEKDAKAPQWLLEEQYRQKPKYDELSESIERAAEASNAANAVLEGLRAKKDMLRMFVRRTQDGNPEIHAG